MSDEADRIHWWSNLLASVAAWGGIALAIVFGAWRQLLGIYCGIRLSMRFAARWGVEADTTWAKILTELDRAKCEIELRTALVERALGLGVFSADPDGLWTWCSAHTAELLGRDTADCVGRLWLAAISDRDRARVAQEWRLCCEQGVPLDVHFGLTDDANDPSLGMVAWEVRREGRVMGFIGQVVIWPGDDPPSWVVRARRKNGPENP